MWSKIFRKPVGHYRRNLHTIFISRLRIFILIHIFMNTIKKMVPKKHLSPFKHYYVSCSNILCALYIFVHLRFSKIYKTFAICLLFYIVYLMHKKFKLLYCKVHEISFNTF